MKPRDKKIFINLFLSNGTASNNNLSPLFASWFDSNWEDFESAAPEDRLSELSDLVCLCLMCFDYYDEFEDSTIERFERIKPVLAALKVDKIAKILATIRQSKKTGATFLCQTGNVGMRYASFINFITMSNDPKRVIN